MSNCIHCGISRSYYHSNEHANRKSCQMSDSGYHSFICSICYYFNKFIKTLKIKKYNIWGRKKHKHYVKT